MKISPISIEGFLSAFYIGRLGARKLIGSDTSKDLNFLGKARIFRL